MDSRTNGQMYRQMDEGTDRLRDGRTVRRMDRWMDGRTDTTSYRDARTHQESGRNVNHELNNVHILMYCPHLSLINQSTPRYNDYCVFDQ